MVALVQPPLSDRRPASESAFQARSAFLLNQNARQVNDKMVKQLLEVVPQGDLFLSKSLEEAERFVQTIVDRGYGTVFTGGGDGTVVSDAEPPRKSSDQKRNPNA